MERKIAAKIHAWTGDEVIVAHECFEHILKKEAFRNMNVLGYLKIILEDPVDIFLEKYDAFTDYLMFYRREIQGYFVAVVKKKQEGVFLCTLHPTGKKIRNKHLVFERIK